MSPEQIEQLSVYLNRWEEIDFDDRLEDAGAPAPTTADRAREKLAAIRSRRGEIANFDAETKVSNNYDIEEARLIQEERDRGPTSWSWPQYLHAPVVTAKATPTSGFRFSTASGQSQTRVPHGGTDRGRPGPCKPPFRGEGRGPRL